MIKNLIKDYSLLNEDEKNSLLNFVCYNENLDAKSYQIVKVLIENRADYLTILSGLFLTDYRKNENLLNEFSLPENVITMLNSIKKIEKINMVNEEISTENIKNLLISMANDIRVILIKLADVLVDAENVNALDKKQADYLHLLIKELYAPIASRLGLSIIKSKLQDLNIKYLHPKEYNKIKQNLNSLKTDREKEIEINISKLKDMLIKLNIKGEVYGRVKHISSIYNKLKDKNYTLSQIFDLMAIRVIVNTENECYEVLSNINSWKSHF